VSYIKEGNHSSNDSEFNELFSDWEKFPAKKKEQIRKEMSHLKQISSEKQISPDCREFPVSTKELKKEFPDWEKFPPWKKHQILKGSFDPLDRLTKAQREEMARKLWSRPHVHLVNGVFQEYLPGQVAPTYPSPAEREFMRGENDRLAKQKKQPGPGRPPTNPIKMKITEYVSQHPGLHIDEKLGQMPENKEKTKERFSSLRDELAKAVFGNQWNLYKTPVREWLRDRETILHRRTKSAPSR